MLDDDFKSEMCRQMDLQSEQLKIQTQCMTTISRVALAYEQNAQAMRTVFKFLAWVIGIVASFFGIADFMRNRHWF